MKQIFVRTEHCMGCHTCELHCAIEHSQAKDLFGATMELPTPKKRLYVELGEKGPMPVMCRMCEDAACLNACISGAMYREPDTGLVLRNPDKCIGCWTCIMTCPFGVVGRMQQGGKLISAKCDRCHENPEGPRCVASCPTKALVHAEPEDWAKQERTSVTGQIAAGQG
ncbi:MAG: 4Fe-4S dicluster domain-containing protein [Dehalococcoidia bacterium]|nr:4Fe-4S dicluster domain-containing protein [Dehalococcoidia bacterium]MDP7239941.1 4Fe-4S dicluster domain-containing protein [Dehalococcoidia bacterium]MDP7469933.1 4Fe-4S dicluster domain-containing protein [Dehalococcoidia bacterium]